MTCCGQNRATLKKNDKAAIPSAAKPVEQATKTALVTGAAAASIRYLNIGHILVRGPRTGWQYEFSAANPVQPVDPRDAQSFVATGLFAYAGRQQ